MFMTHQAEEANESKTDSKRAADRKPLGVSESVFCPLSLHSRWPFLQTNEMPGVLPINSLSALQMSILSDA